MAINVYPPMGSGSGNPIWTTFDNNNVDAFGRLRVSNPYTLFDSQARYAADSSYNYSTANGGTTAYQTNKSSVNLNVTTTSGSSAIGQTNRVFPYQPGKSLLTLQTFTMAPGQTNLTQRVGYFNTNNGVLFQQKDGILYFVIRTYTSGSVSETAIPQSSWNKDTLDGTGKSGITLDVTKTQILFMDFEWLGVGSVRCGFVENGEFITCHQFDNSNIQPFVYMQTAILPLRYEITTTGSTSSAATLQQICGSVISEGGYEQTSQIFNARQPTTTSISTLFTPLVSIRLNSNYLGAVVLPSSIAAFPVASANYEVALIRNVALTGATYAASMSGGQVDVDTAATAFSGTITADSILQSSYVSATNQSTQNLTVSTSFNWDLQLGVTIGGTSDFITLAARTLSGTGSANATLSFYNLTV
jgi:hypothetical protein